MKTWRSTTRKAGDSSIVRESALGFAGRAKLLMATDRFPKRGLSGSVLVVALAASLGACLGPQAVAQTATQAPSGIGTMHGRVLDPSRAPVADARITALPGDGQPPGPSAISDQNGEFFWRSIPDSIRVVAQGFRDIWQTIVLREPGSQSHDFVLRDRASGVRKRETRRRLMR